MTLRLNTYTVEKELFNELIHLVQDLAPERTLSLSFRHQLSVRILYINLRIDLGSRSVFLISCPTFREEMTKLLLESKLE